MRNLWIRFLRAVPLLWLCRFSLLSVLAGSIVLVFVDQAQEALIRIMEASQFGQVVELLLFFAGLAAWATGAWYCARVLLRFRFPASPASSPELTAIAKWLPRAIGTSVFVFAAIATFTAGAYAGTATWRICVISALCMAEAALFMVAVCRRPWRLSLAQRGAGRHTANPDSLYFGIFATTTELPLPVRRWMIGWLALALLFFPALTFAPHELGPAIGAMTILILAFAMWIPFGSLLVFLSERWQRAPLMGLLLAAAVAWSFCPVLDNHDVRRLDVPPAPRAEFREHVRNWLRERGSEIEASASYPVVLGAASGGGIRAAYWTAAVLGEMQDRCPAFARHVLALSGVSGGSLGIAVFAAQLAERADALLKGPPTCAADASPGLREASSKMLRRDFLSPTAATMMFPDLAYRFVPLAFLPQRFTDRGTTLEDAWARAWRDVTGQDRLSEPFSSLRAGQAARIVPGLVLNSTSVETGRRVIVSHFRTDKTPFSDAYDALCDNAECTAGRDMPVKSSIHMSARFTYVSPAGTLRRADGKAVWGRVVDGGYFENSGHTATLEMAQEFQLCVDEEKYCFDDDAERTRYADKVKLVVLSITNDPDLPDDEAGPPAPRPARFLNEALSPLRALLNARDGHAGHAEEAAMQFARDYGGAAIALRVKRQDAMLPLGWTLASPSVKNLDKQVDERGPQFDQLKALLEGRNPGEGN
jgi:hypothetical protein